MTSLVKKLCEKDVVGIVIFDLIGLLPTNHILAYIIYNGIPEFVRKSLMLTVKSLKQSKVFENSTVRKSILQKWQTMAIICDISDSNLETG